MDDYNNIFSRLGPDGLQALMGMGELDEQGDMLDQQMQQALALRQAGPQRYGAVGQGLQSIADTLNAFRSYRDEKDIRGQMHGNMGAKTYARNRMAQALGASFGFGGGGDDAAIARAQYANEYGSGD